MQPNQINFSDLNFTSPIVASDGTLVMVTQEGLVNLLFIQMRGEKNGQPHADVVAGVRLHNLEELKNLSKTLQDTIQKHENREP